MQVVNPKSRKYQTKALKDGKISCLVKFISDLHIIECFSINRILKLGFDFFISLAVNYPIQSFNQSQEF